MRRFYNTEHEKSNITGCLEGMYLLYRSKQYSDSVEKFRTSCEKSQIDINISQIENPTDSKRSHWLF